MSGLEVAGLVLAVLPFVLKSVDAYRDGLHRFGTFFKKRKHVEKLARALLLQQSFLEQLIKSIALESGCEGILALQLLDENPILYLENIDVQEQVKQYLGPRNSTILVKELELNSETVRKLARAISGLVPSTRGPTDDLMAIIDANRDKPNLPADLAPRIKLLLSITDMKAIIQEIDAAFDKLDRFSRLTLSNCKAMASNSSQKATKLAKAFRQIRGIAGSLYKAVEDGFRNQCHESHGARLYLNDRIDDAHRILHRSGATDPDTPLLIFDLVFYAGNQNSILQFYETAVHVPKGYNTDSDQYNSNNNSPPCSPTGTAVTFCVTAAPPTISKPQVATITSICTTIESVGSITPRLSFVLMGNCRIGTFFGDSYKLGTHSLVAATQGEQVSLSQILQATTTTLPIKPRMQLALQLASSLLQLQHTQWLAQAWSKNTVFFLRLGSHATQTRVNLNQPFITHNFDFSQRVENPPGPKEILLELGILLLEIWHGTTLEARFGSDEASGPALTRYYERLACALEWGDDGEMQGLYGQAVSHCLTGNNGSARRSLDWEDIKLWSSIYSEIIKPLLTLFKQF